MKDERKQPNGYLLPPSLPCTLQSTSTWKAEQLTQFPIGTSPSVTRHLAQSEPVEARRVTKNDFLGQKRALCLPCGKHKRQTQDACLGREIGTNRCQQFLPQN